MTMLDISAIGLSELRSSFTMYVRVSSWLNDDALSDSVPVASGSLTIDRSLTVPESLSFTVPRIADGINWDPTGLDHPLGTNGQTVSLQIGIGVVSDIEWLDMGLFLLTDTSAEGDTVSCQASGLLKLIDEARFLAPFQPTSTLSDTVQSLIEPALTVNFDSLLVDRATPLSMQWDEDRLAALNEVLDAWPAEAEVTPDGYLDVHVPVDYTSLTPVWEFTDDADTGTVTKWQGSNTRDGAFNVVVARGEDSTGQQIQGVAYDTDPNSATYYGGPFSPLPVPFMYYSPLLNTVDQCRKAANTILARKRRQAGRILSLESVPCPVLRPGDLVSITSAEKDLKDIPATLEMIELPLNPGGGVMRCDVTLIGA